jgi:O-antigen/teichoic acid export membrane protein
VKIPVLMTLFTQAFNYAAEPFFFRNAEREDSREIYGQVGQAFTLVAVLVFLGITLYIDLIKFIIGKDLRDGIGIVPIFVVAYVLLGLCYNFSIWYKLTDRTRIGSVIALGGMAITLLVNAVLVPRIGIYGPAWAALACYFFMTVAAYWTGRRYYPINYPVRRMVLYLLIGLAGFFINDWARSYMGAHIGMILLFNTLVLLICLFGIYLVDRNLIRSVWRSVRIRKR